MIGHFGTIVLNAGIAASFLIMASEFISDCDRVSLARAGRRGLRKSQILAMGNGYREISSLSTYQQYVATVAKRDRLFFLSERQYLASGFTARQRMEAALVHFRHESEAFDGEYVRHVYSGGLTLWRSFCAGVDYVIRLVPGRDVFQEGALSVVLEVDGACVCILSYSFVPSRILLAGATEADSSDLDESIIFVTRKHLSRDHGYQAQFNKAFDRVTPSHLCFGALTGLALAQGYRHMFGISPERHPAYSYAYRDAFVSAYTDFWASMAGRRISPYGYLVNLPIRLTPLSEIDASKRKRAMLRRAHIEAVQCSARDVIAGHLRRKASA